MIRAKGRKMPSVEAKAIFKGLECKFKISDELEKDEGKLIFTKKENKDIAFFGPKDELVKFKERYEKKHPKVKWTDTETEQNIPLEGYLDFGLCAEEVGLRLAAKVAFEWLCYKRYKEDKIPLMDKDFDSLRHYILSGKIPEMTLASIVTDKKILSALNNILFGNHCLIISSTIDKAQVAFFGLFGVIYYKVILQRYYPLITKKQEMGIINPQRKGIYEPTFQQRYIPITALDSYHCVKPQDALLRIFPDVIKKINADFKLHMDH